MTAIRKKTLRLLLYDYQRTTRYYTIYRTFKRWSSDDFTTIPRLSATTIPEAVTTIPAGTLRLLLTSIGYRAKARKEVRRQVTSGSARPPRSCCWTAPPGGGCALTADRCQIVIRRAGMVCDLLRSYMPYYNRAAALTCAASGVAVVSGTGEGVALDGMPSGAAQAVYRRLVYMLYCVRWNGSNRRKHRCKAL